MLDDILSELVGEAVFGRLGRSERAKLVARLFFGVLGAALCAAGAVYMMLRPGRTTNLPMFACLIGVFGFLACFWLFNVALLRKWRWPGVMFAASFVGMFVARILFGR